MKRKLLTAITAIIALATLVGVLAGCTESLKQDAIPTVTGGAVYGNGGMTAVYGDYLYFINGYAGETADNTFGKVVKGSIARVELKNGVPDGKATIIVPKNVYGTDTQYGGIYISNGFVYYATTSTDLDGNGNPKTGRCVLMRTAVDGTNTQKIAEFDDHKIVFKVVGDKLVYVRSNGIYSIDLNSKKFAVSTVEKTIASGYVIEGDYIYYNAYVDDDTANYVMKAYPLAGGEAKELLSASIFGKTGVKYTFGIISVIDEGDKARVFYSKTDDAQGKPEEGIYSTVFAKSDFAYSADNVSRFTQNSSGTTNLAYTKFYKVGPYYLGYASTKMDAFYANGERVLSADGIESLNPGSSITVFEIEEKADGAYMWYFDSNSVLRKIKLIEKVGDTWSFVEGNETKIFSGKYDKTYVGIEKVGNVLYYFNSSVSNNAYYYVIDDEKPAEGQQKILGIITETDVIAAF